MSLFRLCPTLLLASAILLPLAAEAADNAEASPQAVPATEPAVQDRVVLGVVPDTTTGLLDDAGGVVIKRVEELSTADKLGLQAGDIITRFNDHQIKDVADLKAVLEAQKVGNEASIGYLRDDQPMAATGILRGKLRPRDIEEVKKSVQRARVLAEEAGTDTGNFARSLRYLAIALNELPDRVEEASRQFKRIYPDGTFRVHIDIEIDTHANADPALRLEYGENPDGTPIETPEEADQADEQAEAEPGEAPDGP